MSVHGDGHRAGSVSDLQRRAGGEVVAGKRRHRLIERAVQILRGGGLVAFPTETVYGLGADARSESAVARIFAAKCRPATNPLIVHVYSIEAAKRYVTHWPPVAQKLAEAFWPGPLTLVLPKHPQIVAMATAGLNSVGVRIPNHPLALELLKAFDGPVAAPSANRSNHVSPTTARHVRDELGDLVDLILDGGPCDVGIESTVLDLSSSPRVLRPGHVTAAQIANVIGQNVQHGTMILSSTEASISPGQQQKHYAPRTPAFRFRPSQRNALDLTNAAVIEITLDPTTYARNFYARLRLLDTQNLTAIYIEMPPDTPEWLAVRDRIRRATREL